MTHRQYDDSWNKTSTKKYKGWKFAPGEANNRELHPMVPKVRAEAHWRKTEQKRWTLVGIWVRSERRRSRLAGEEDQLSESGANSLEKKTKPKKIELGCPD